MSQFYLVASFRAADSAGGVVLPPGKLVDEATYGVATVAAWRSAGAELWPAGDTLVAAAALAVQNRKNARGLDEKAAEAIMRAAVAQSQAGAGGSLWTLVSGAFVVGAGNYDVDVSSVSASATMPASPSQGETHGFKVGTNAPANNLVLSAAAGQTIEQDDGTFGASYTFNKGSQELSFFYESTTARWRAF